MNGYRISSIKRGWTALGGAVFAAAAAAAVALTVRGGWRRGAWSPDDIGVALLAFFFALPLVLLFGLPVFLLLRALGWLRWWSCALAGAFGGFLLVAAARQPQPWSTWQASEVPLWCVIGAISALAFWLSMLDLSDPTAAHDDSGAALAPHPAQAGASLDAEFLALVQACVAHRPRTVSMPQPLAALRERHGLSRDGFCDAFAGFVARAFVRGELSYADADCAINDLAASHGPDLPAFALSLYHAFDAGEYRHPGDPEDSIAWQRHTLPAVVQILAGRDPARPE